MLFACVTSRARRCMEAPIATIDSERLRYSADAASASDSAIAIEVNRHVEADTDGLDITSGLWLDHPQVGLFTLHISACFLFQGMSPLIGTKMSNNS